MQARAFEGNGEEGFVNATRSPGTIWDGTRAAVEPAPVFH